MIWRNIDRSWSYHIQPNETPTWAEAHTSPAQSWKHTFVSTQYEKQKAVTCAVEGLCSSWLAALFLLWTRCVLSLTMFSIFLWLPGKLLFMETFLFTFRIKSRSLACLPGPTKSSVMWSVPAVFSLTSEPTTFPLAATAHLYWPACLPQTCKVIPAFWTFDVPSTCYALPTTPPLSSDDSLLPFRPAPQSPFLIVPPTPRGPTTHYLVPFYLLTLLYCLHSTDHCPGLHNSFICLPVYCES